jgi:hypothetical protein
LWRVDPIYPDGVVLRCTRRACDLLRIRQSDIPAAEDDWYQNVLWIDRRKCLLFTHATTLFPVFAADVRAADIRPIGPYAVGVLSAAPRAEQCRRAASDGSWYICTNGGPRRI